MQKIVKHVFFMILFIATARDVRSQDMVTVSRPNFEISCLCLWGSGLSLGLVLIVSVSSLMV